MKCAYDSADELCSHHTKDIKRIKQNRGKRTQNRKIKIPNYRNKKRYFQTSKVDDDYLETESERGGYAGVRTHCFGKR